MHGECGKIVQGGRHLEDHRLKPEHNEWLWDSRLLSERNKTGFRRSALCCHIESVMCEMIITFERIIPHLDIS
jgi:hypothetical protein